MATSKWKQLIEELKEERKIDAEEINEYLKQSKKIKTKSDKINFLKEYVKTFPRPKAYVQKYFFEYANPSKKFVEFLVFTITETSVMIDACTFTEIYQKDKKLFEFLCTELAKNKNDSISYVLGTMIGGMGRWEPEQMFILLNKKTFPNNFENILISAVWETSPYQKIPKIILKKILEYSKSKDEKIRNGAIRFLINRFNKNKKVQSRLLQLAKSDDQTQSWINQLSCNINKENPSLYFKLTEQCFEYGNKNLKNEIIVNWYHHATQYPTECLNIIKKSIRKYTYSVLHQMTCGSLEQIGESKKYTQIEKILFDWIEIENSRSFIDSTSPTIQEEIHLYSEKEFLKLLRKLDYTEKKQSEIIGRALKVYLSPDYVKVSSAFLKTVKKLLLKIAKFHHIDDTIDEKLKGEYMEVLALVENIIHHKKKIKAKIVKRNLECYPNLLEFLSKQEICRLIDESPNHPLIELLHIAKVSTTTLNKYTKEIERQSDPWLKNLAYQALLKQFYPDWILSDLDASVGRIGNYKSKEIRQMLLEPKQFDSTMIQITMFSRIKEKKYDVKLEPQVAKKKLDLKMTMDKQEYYFEIYTPQENKELRYRNTEEIIDTEDIKSRISEKLEDQLEAADSLNKPVIVVIYNQNWVGDEYDICNALYGTLQLKILWNKKTGETKFYPTRKDNSIGSELEYGNVISAIIIVRKYVDNVDMKMKISGQTSPIPSAKIPLNEETLKKIEGVLFETELQKL